jgi:transcriptional regulator with XRE-family HTH domain
MKSSGELPEQRFADVLKRRRTEQGIGLPTLARETGIHTTFLRGVEAGKRTIGGEYLLKLAIALGLTGGDKRRFIDAGKATGWIAPGPKPAPGVGEKGKGALFAQLLREERTKAGLTLRQLAEKAQLAHTVIARAEAGKRSVGEGYATQLATALGITGHQLDRFVTAALDTTVSERILKAHSSYPAALLNWIPAQLRRAGISGGMIEDIETTEIPPAEGVAVRTLKIHAGASAGGSGMTRDHVDRANGEVCVSIELKVTRKNSEQRSFGRESSSARRVRLQRELPPLDPTDLIRISRTGARPKNN